MLERIEDFKGYYTDPSFANSDCKLIIGFFIHLIKIQNDLCLFTDYVILPIKYVYRRSLTLDMLVDWLRVLKASPGFFKVSSLTMDFSKDSEMEIINHMTREVTLRKQDCMHTGIDYEFFQYLNSFHVGRYKLHRTATPEEAALLENEDDPDAFDQLVMHGAAIPDNVQDAPQPQQQQQQQPPAPGQVIQNAIQVLVGHGGEIDDLLVNPALGVGPVALANFGANLGGGGGAGGSAIGDPQSSGAGLKWRMRVCNFDKLTALTISSLSVISPSRKVPDNSEQLPNLVLIQSWSEVIENLTNLKELSIKYQTLRGKQYNLVNYRNNPTNCLHFRTSKAIANWERYP